MLPPPVVGLEVMIRVACRGVNESPGYVNYAVNLPLWISRAEKLLPFLKLSI